MKVREELSVTLKKYRQEAGFTIKALAQELGIDASLMSRYENGERRLNDKQLRQISKVLKADINELKSLWVAEYIVSEFGYEESTIKGMYLAEEAIKYGQKKVEIPIKLKRILEKVDHLKLELIKLRPVLHNKVKKVLELEYTYESNQIEGNTLSLKETSLIINEGLTISGKTMREHLEAINHTEAIEYLDELVRDNEELSEHIINQIHNLILRGIDSENAGKYRNVQVMIGGSKHLPPQPYLVSKAMEDFMFWYNDFKNRLHPIVLAAEVHLRVVTIHPFIDGNGRTSRLLMNLILLQNGYPIANIKGSKPSRRKYYSELENSQTTKNHSDFVYYVANEELKAIKRLVDLLKPPEENGV
jgi:Fic family protein/DNA-binding XRE family transcriptional regulator